MQIKDTWSGKIFTEKFEDWHAIFDVPTLVFVQLEFRLPVFWSGSPITHKLIHALVGLSVCRLYS